jgi:hypothetical protein
LDAFALAFRFAFFFAAFEGPLELEASLSPDVEYPFAMAVRPSQVRSSSVSRFIWK